VENSIEGSVTESLDAFAEYDVAVVQEIITPIRHALLAQGDSFETVASHAQALAQCRGFLESHYPDANLEAVASTARGVQRARDDAAFAAIGHPANAADAEELQVLAEDIQDQSSNATRFLVVAPAEERSDAGSKSSFIVYPTSTTPACCWNCWNRSPTGTSTSPASSPAPAASAWATTSSTWTSPPASTRSAPSKRWPTSGHRREGLGSTARLCTTPRRYCTEPTGASRPLRSVAALMIDLF